MKVSTLDKLIYYYKHFIIVLSLIILATPQYTILGKINFIIVGAGAILCVLDLLFNRNFLKAKRMLWLILFLLSFGISIILNIKLNLNLNIISLGYAVISLIILYPLGNKSKDDIINELFNLNNTFLVCTLVLSSIGLVMYVILFNYTYNYAQYQDYIVGWSYTGRLFGLYTNPCRIISVYALVFSIMQIEISKFKFLNGMPKYYKAFIIASLIINFCHMVLENAKGGYYSLTVFIIIYAFTKTREKLSKSGKTEIKGYIYSLMVAAASVVVFFIAIHVSRFLLPFLPKIYVLIKNLILGTNTSTNIETLENFTIDRDIPDYYGALTGRPKIWVRGIQEFLKKPVFGWGPLSLSDIFVLNVPLRNLHNVIVQSLTGTGIVGTFFFVFFLSTTAVEILRKLWSNNLRKEKYYNVIYTGVGFLALQAVNSMAESTIMFSTNIGVFLFWIYLGYIVKLMYDGKNSHFDKPLLYVYNKLNKGKGE